jgi:hypothetical protein
VQFGGFYREGFHLGDGVLEWWFHVHKLSKVSEKQPRFYRTSQSSYLHDPLFRIAGKSMHW